MSIRVKTDDAVYFLESDMLGQGETSCVYPGHTEGQESASAQWAIKVAKDIHHNGYISREFDTLQSLHQAMQAIPASSRAFPDVEPLPTVTLGTAADDRQALVMQPVLTQSLLAVFETLADPLARQQLALTAARQYADLLLALTEARISCQDRKLSDLWWVGPAETGHLIVTDWNVISDTFNPVLDLRKFGLLWFELLIGSQMPPSFQPHRQDFEQIQDKISYGLWYAISRAISTGIGAQFCHAQELVDVLESLDGYHHQSATSLAKQARTSLTQAQANLDRAQADWAWMQFDIAQRLNPNRPVAGLEQARLWAYDPVAQAAPGLVRKLASPQLSEAKEQLQELQKKVQRPQEQGDINRTQYGFDLLNLAKDALITDSATSGLAEVAQNFAKTQELLVDGVLCTLMKKDGATAHKNLQSLTHMLPPNMGQEGQEKLTSLEQEAQFWIAYHTVQRTLYDSPDQAISPLEKCKTVRQTIEHWPNSYEPTVDDLERLQTLADTNLRAAVLAGQTTKIPQITATFSNHPNAPLVLKNSWDSTITELLLKLEDEPENDEVKHSLKSLYQRLEKARQDLAESRLGPARLDERVNIVSALLQIPATLQYNASTPQQLQHELKDLQQLQHQIRLDQQELFENPEPVLNRAINDGYELFDDAGLSVAALKIIYQAGRWDNKHFTEEILHLDEQADRFLVLSEILTERKETLEQTIALYASLATPDTTAEINTFLSNTLEIYLTTAQVQIKAEKSAAKSLARAHHLLQQAQAFLPEDKLALYQNLYDHLLELADDDLILTAINN